MQTLNRNSIVKPVHQKLSICPSCNHKLTFFEKRRKTKDGKILCSKCSAVFHDKNIVY